MDLSDRFEKSTRNEDKPSVLARSRALEWILVQGAGGVAGDIKALQPFDDVDEDYPDLLAQIEDADEESLSSEVAEVLVSDLVMVQVFLEWQRKSFEKLSDALLAHLRKLDPNWDQ